MELGDLLLKAHGSNKFFGPRPWGKGCVHPGEFFLRKGFRVCHIMS